MKILESINGKERKFSCTKKFSDKYLSEKEEEGWKFIHRFDPSKPGNYLEGKKDDPENVDEIYIF